MATDWAGMASAYELSFGRLCAGSLPFLIDRSRVAVPGTALDAGTGTGSVAAALTARGFTVHGVDADPGMVAFASAQHPDVRFSVDALPRLSFANGTFALTVANFVINHVPKPRAAVQELARVTADGGLVLVTIWPSSPISPMNQLWNRVITDSGVIPLSGHRLPAQDDFERSRGGLGQLLAEAGLTDVTAEQIGWDFRIDADQLWIAVEAGIANIGATYRQQNLAGKRAMRAVFEDITELGELTLRADAVLGAGRAP